LDILDRAGWQMGDRPLVALTPRTLRIADGEAETHYTLKTQEQFQKEIDVYSAVLDWLWEHGYQPLFVPMNTVAPDDDRIASRIIMATARHGTFAMIVDEEIYPRAAAAIYERCEVSLVSRVHGSIMSFKSNCPVIMYAFDQKHIGIMQEMGLTDFIFHPQKHDVDTMIELIANTLKNAKDTRAFLTRQLEISSEKSVLPLQQSLKILNGK
jgi:polysaccharide pyruvyl transferase WcaK-like protein